jgi:hypothetical protein
MSDKVTVTKDRLQADSSVYDLGSSVSATATRAAGRKCSRRRRRRRDSSNVVAVDDQPMIDLSKLVSYVRHPVTNYPVLMRDGCIDVVP